MDSIITLFRPHQYIKNFFIFAPLLFTFHISLDCALQSLYAFMLFSILSSGVYIFNDLQDIEEDKKHPIKKSRPLANGDISINLAKKIMMTLFFSSLFLAMLAHFQLFLVMLTYLLINIFYSLGLKHIAILDIFMISTGFVLRLFAGSVVTDTPLSMWIIIITFLLAIFLALAKRRDDVLLSLNGSSVRKNIDGYNLEFVNSSMTLMSGVVIVSYIQYSVSADVVLRVGSDYLYLTSFFVILGFLRYMQITFVEEKSGSPTNLVLSDTFLQITILLWLLSFVIVAIL